MSLRAATIAIALLAGTASASAEGAESIDLLFKTPHLERMVADQEIRYRHERETLVDGAAGPALDTTVLLARKQVGDRLETVITMDADGARRQLDAFRGVPGNPIMMVFMEGVTHSLSRATGGSPFYIRNRLKEGFATGVVETSADASTITMHPFENDRNKARMGPFANLEITMSLDPARPGMFGSLKAVVNDATHPELSVYREEISYVEEN